MKEKTTVHVFFRLREYYKMKQIADSLNLSSIAALIRLAIDNYILNTEFGRSHD